VFQYSFLSITDIKNLLVAILPLCLEQYLAHTWPSGCCKPKDPNAYQISSTPNKGDFLPAFVSMFQITLLDLLPSQSQGNWEAPTDFSASGNQTKLPLIPKQHFPFFFFTLNSTFHCIASYLLLLPNATDSQPRVRKMVYCCYHYY